MPEKMLSVFEICAGGGGQALGLDQAGFDLAGAAEIESYACETLRLNRPTWKVLETDIRELNGRDLRGITLLAGGVPCPPFSVAGKQLGKDDERDLFPEALRLIEESNPEAVMLENVRGFSSDKFSGYRESIFSKLAALGYKVAWKVLSASDFGVPQLRPRFVLVAIKERYAGGFMWPRRNSFTKTVSAVIGDQMLSCGWQGGHEWAKKANGIAPTIVGGSKKHGGPDLGPSRAKRQWAELGVDGSGIANNPPDQNTPVDHMPKLTVPMVARIQGFPDEWKFFGKKTVAYRQVGNAFPPPVAKAVGEQIKACLLGCNAEIQQYGQLSLYGPYEPKNIGYTSEDFVAASGQGW